MSDDWTDYVKLIPSVEDVFGRSRPPHSTSTARAGSNARLTDTRQYPLPDKRTALQKQGLTAKQEQNYQDYLSGKQAQRQAERIKNFPKTLRDIRGNHWGNKWQPNKATVKQWAKEQSTADYIDGSGSSTCFDSLVWHVEDGQSGEDAMGVAVAVFNNRSNPVEYSYEVSRSTFLAWIAGSEGGFFNSSGLYDKYL
jgi:hypothetical protein